MNDTTMDLINAINQSGGLKIQMTAIQDWTQYWILILVTLIGSVFIIIYLLISLKPQLSVIFAWFKLRKLMKITGRHVLIIKHTKEDLFDSSMITTHTLKNIRKALSDFKGKPFDLVLHTPGGSIFAAQLISKLLKKYPSTVRALIPVYAMSGGSFLALSCDKILLANTAAIGAIDPQIGYLWHYGSAKSWEEVIKKKNRKAEDGSIQMAYTGKQYAETLYKWVFNLLEDKIPDAQIRMKAATYLTDGNIEHGRPLMISDLNEIGIPVTELDDKLTELIDPIINSDFYEGVYWK